MASGIYKSGQGYYTRMGTCIGAALLGLLGLYWLWNYSLIKIGNITPTYTAAAITITIGAILTYFIYSLVYRKPASGDFLIATEGEMKKVNWSTRREIVGSTGVVIATMVLVTGFIFLVDQLFVLVFSSMKVLDAW